MPVERSSIDRKSLLRDWLRFQPSGSIADAFTALPLAYLLRKRAAGEL